MPRTRDDPLPIDESCTCYTCRNFSRAYLRHLIAAREMLSSTLLSIHNLHTLLSLMADLRQAIFNGNLEAFTADFFAARQAGSPETELEPPVF